jgi:hypothetical protein
MGMMDSKEAEYMNISVQDVLVAGIFAKINQTKNEIDLFITEPNDIKGYGLVIDQSIKMLEESISFYRKEVDLSSPTQIDRRLNELKDKWERTKMTFNQQKRTV